jgi:hypothetical protein
MRPKGSKNKVGLTVEQRVKILTKLALDKTLKPTDRISAISQITSLLNDRVQDASYGAIETVLSFNPFTDKNNGTKEKLTETTPTIQADKTSVIPVEAVKNNSEVVTTEAVIEAWKEVNNSSSFLSTEEVTSKLPVSNTSIIPVQTTPETLDFTFVIEKPKET